MSSTGDPDYALYRSNGYLIGKVTDPRNEVEVIPVADLHAGTATFFESGFLEVVRYIRENKAYWWGNGDLMEVGQKTSPGGGVYDQVMNPQEQRKYLLDKLEPIQSQCLGLVKGNHEERIYKATGYDPMMLLAEALRVPYFGWEFFGVVTLGAETHHTGFTIYSCHTYAGNKTAGLAFNWMEREIERWLDNVDIIVKSHDHGKGFIPAEYVYFEPRDPCVKIRTRYLVLSGHFMHRPNSYIAGRSGGPKPPGTVSIRLKLLNKEKVISCKEVPNEEWLLGYRAKDLVEEVHYLGGSDSVDLHGED